MSNEASHVHNITLGAAMRKLFPGNAPTDPTAVNAALAHEAGDRLLALFEIFEMDPAQAMREVERLDVYRARRLLALLLLLVKNIMDEHEEDDRRREAVINEVRAAHVGGIAEGSAGGELCILCLEPLPCGALRLADALR